MNAIAFPPLKPHLSGREKAAVIVRLMLVDGIDVPLNDMPPHIQSSLAQCMGSMGAVSKETVAEVVHEFVTAVDTLGVSFPGGLAGVLAMLEGKIDAETFAQLKRQIAVVGSNDPWDQIVDLPTEVLLPIFEAESTEIGAIMLSKLRVAKAAEILGMMSGPMARQLTYSMSRTGSVAPATVARIGRALADQLSAKPVNAFDKGPVDRVGAILNFSPAVTRDDVLDGLEEADKSFADEVRKAIFTFANISTRVDPRDVPTITRDVDPDVLTMALAAATGPLEASAEFILGNLSKRMADQLREDAEALGQVRSDDGEAAMAKVVAAIRTLEEAGTIFLVAEDED